MSEAFEPEIVISCSGNCLQKLYIDLCNLIVESRSPRFNDRGYGDGIHCPPLLGPSKHICDFSKSECQKHQRLIHHLFRAVASNVFEIEVIVLPDCCSDLKLKERIQKGEYALLERWSMKCFYSKVQSAVDVPELLRAVRSFLHFSQISAWLSSTKGKCPSNIYYWVKSSLDEVSTSFDKDPEIHSFPTCKIIEDLYGTVKVKYPTRTQYVPGIPCSKHPPLHGYSFRTISNSSNLTQNISLNSEIVRQLQKTASDDQNTEQSYASEPQTLLLTPATILKTFSNNTSHVNKPIRVVKPSYCQNHLINASFDIKQCKTMDMASKSQTSYVCNYAETFTNALIHEKACLSKTRYLHKQKLQLQKMNGTTHSQEASAFPFEPKSQVNQILEKSDVSASTELSKKTVLKPFEASLTKETYQSPKILQKKRPLSSKESTKLPRKIIFNDVDVSSKFCKNVPIHLNEMNSKYSSQVRHLSHISRSVEDGKCSSQNSYVKHEIKNSREKDPLKCLSLSSVPLRKKRKLANLKNYKKLRNSDEYFPKVLLREDDVFKITDDVGLNGSLIKDEQKNINECNEKYNSTSLANVGTSDKTGQNISFNDKFLEKKILLQRKKSKRQNFFHSIHKLRCPDKLSEAASSYNSDYQTLQIDLKNELLQRNEFKMSLNFTSELNPVCFQVENSETGLLQDKTLPRCKRKFLSACGDIGIKNRPENECESGKNSQKHLNSSESLLNVKQKKRIKRSIKFSLKNLKKEKPKNTIEPIELNESETNVLRVRNRSRGKRKKSNCNEFISSQSCALTKGITSTSCTMENFQYRYVQPKSVCTKQLSTILLDTNTTPSTSVLPNNFQGLEMQSSDVEERNSISHGCKWNSGIESKMLPHSSIKQCTCDLNGSIPFKKRYTSCEFPKVPAHFLKNVSKFPLGKKLLVNFEESILKGCLPVLRNVQGFHAEIGASGSFFPNHLTLPADVSFYDLGNSHQGAAPYVAHVILGNAEYFLPRKGAVQVTLFNPSETVVKMFVLNYDLSTMPPMCHTFIRQKIYYLPVCSPEESPGSQKWLRFIIHLKFASSKTGKIFMYNDFKIVVLNKSNDDAASEFNQEPRELRSFVSAPMNPTFSSF
ncbi:protein FAM214A [Trichonephila clavata]|uniref:Protein FAM214A n=1 Tax=Trichonephila clavata TaxID=2740835 RepID=A0A8X6LIQ2_TRICU|nr:protein FAM214A [Trichonephila clavata]